MAQETEHRESTRRPHEASILIENLPGGTYYHGKMINYSERGMYFESNVAHQPGTNIIFGIENSPYDACRGVYRAEVKWCKKLPHEASMYYFGVGVEYAGPDASGVHGKKTIGIETRKQPPHAEGSPPPAEAAVASKTRTNDAVEPNNDLRKHPRKPYAQMVLYATDKRFYEGSIKDISNSGVFIETNKDLYVGQTLTLAIPTRKPRKEVKLKGEIVRIEPHGLGIKFKAVIKN
jgi:Tfp pilus assembly protein PilZ